MRKKKREKGKGKKKKKKKFPFTGFFIVVVENKYEVVGWELKSLKFGVFYYYTQGVFVHVGTIKVVVVTEKKKTKHTHTHHMITKWTMAGTPWIYNQFYQTQTKLTMLWVLYYYYYHYTYKSLDYTSQCCRWYHCHTLTHLHNNHRHAQFRLLLLNKSKSCLSHLESFFDHHY